MSSSHLTTKCADFISSARGLMCKHQAPAQITLIAPLDSDSFKELSAWRGGARAGKLTTAKDATIGLYAAGDRPGDGQPSVVYHLHDAWPEKLRVNNFKAGGSNATVLTITLAARSITRTS